MYYKTFSQVVSVEAKTRQNNWKELFSLRLTQRQQKGPLHQSINTIVQYLKYLFLEDYKNRYIIVRREKKELPLNIETDEMPSDTILIQLKLS